MNKQKKNEKGFTMVELIIVVAIMGIIGALLVPAFGTMSAKARLSTDIATVKTLKRTADSYKAEKGTFPASSGDTLSNLVSTLKSTNYLETEVSLQTGGTITINASEQIKLNVSSGDYSKALEQIDSATKSDWVTSY